MVLSRGEKEKLVLDLYYNKGYTYRDIAKELKMSPNQIRDSKEAQREEQCQSKQKEGIIFIF
jgi:transposase